MQINHIDRIFAITIINTGLYSTQVYSRKFAMLILQTFKSGYVLNK